MVDNIEAGGATINVLAGSTGATVRTVDVAVDRDAGDTDRVRRSSGTLPSRTR